MSVASPDCHDRFRMASQEVPLIAVGGYLIRRPDDTKDGLLTTGPGNGDGGSAFEDIPFQGFRLRLIDIYHRAISSGDRSRPFGLSITQVAEEKDGSGEGEFRR